MLRLTTSPHLGVALACHHRLACQQCTVPRSDDLLSRAFADAVDGGCSQEVAGVVLGAGLLDGSGQDAGIDGLLVHGLFVDSLVDGRCQEVALRTGDPCNLHGLTGIAQQQDSIKVWVLSF